MNATELGQTALVGWRDKLADGLAKPLSRRTGVEEEQLRAVVGGLFFALSVYYVVGTLRRALDQARG